MQDIPAGLVPPAMSGAPDSALDKVRPGPRVEQLGNWLLPKVDGARRYLHRNSTYDISQVLGYLLRYLTFGYSTLFTQYLAPAGSQHSHRGAQAYVSDSKSLQIGLCRALTSGMAHSGMAHFDLLNLALEDERKGMSKGS